METFIAEAFLKEGHIPSGRSETFIMTLVEDATTSGAPITNKHSAIPKTDGTASVVDLSEHGSATTVFIALECEGHIPSGRGEAVGIALVYDAAHEGMHIVNIHRAHHPAGVTSAYIEEAVHGEVTFEHAHEFIEEGHIPSGRTGEIHEITLVYDAIHMVNTDDVTE